MRIQRELEWTPYLKARCDECDCEIDILEPVLARYEDRLFSANYPVFILWCSRCMDVRGCIGPRKDEFINKVYKYRPKEHTFAVRHFKYEIYGIVNA